MKKNVLYAFAISLLISCSSESTDEEVFIAESTPEVVEENLSETSDTNNSNSDENNDNNTGNTNGTNQVTFTVDIQPIINANCITCHRDPPRNGAPFPLLTFNQVNNRSALIFSQVNAGLMPPSGKLPDTEIDLIEQWIANGKPE